MISAIVFTGYPEEEEYLEACLSTLAWVDEIIVVETGISDQARKIISKYTDRIYFEASMDFSNRHNLGKDKARGDWLLYVDADERVSARLAKEIQEEIRHPRADAYQLFRINYFLGKEVRFGDRYPDYITRLFRKAKLVKWVNPIHESSVVRGTISQLTGPMYHLTHRDIFSMMRKTIIFSEPEARMRLVAKHPSVVWWRLVRVFLTEFYYRIVRLSGWRQGTEGWIDGIFQAFSLFVVYSRLWELQRRPSLGQSYKEIDKKILSEFK